MVLFRKEEMKFDETAMHEFWNWFRDHQETGIFNIVKEMGLRLKNISGMDGDTTWFDLSCARDGKMGIIDFYANDRFTNSESLQIYRMYRLIELAPPDIRESWDLPEPPPYYKKMVKKYGSI